MIEYVLIYASLQFQNDQVLLILKNRPKFLAGKLNLLGGKIEPGETPELAVIRELKEESGLDVASNPIICGKIFGEDCVVYCCTVDIKENIICPREVETELVEWHKWSTVVNDRRLMPNLRIIIPLLHFKSTGWMMTDMSVTNEFYDIALRLER